ncbi:hypothetical protein AYI69_g3714 [Smittium culicis]|uniref:Uncharacterized protein n=1 Tax=Smittium culicis TaxID=133412 RepID=A0A1R1YIY4_9FUNG|nr:hypothetical protein AYI69_g3714 [Smittium culicis]
MYKCSGHAGAVQKFVCFQLKIMFDCTSSKLDQRLFRLPPQEVYQPAPIGTEHIPSSSHKMRSMAADFPTLAAISGCLVDF